MGPEIIAAILGPTLGGTISLILFLNKRSSDFIAQEFLELNSSVKTIERKVDDLSLEVAKNYVTNEQLTAHIQGEEDWHKTFSREMVSMKDDIRETRWTLDRMRNHE